MPTLPTITVTQAQADQLLAAFNGDVGAYKEWLRQKLIEYVVEKRADELRVAAVTDQQTKLQALRDSMPPRGPDAPPPPAP